MDSIRDSFNKFIEPETFKAIGKQPGGPLKQVGIVALSVFAGIATLGAASPIVYKALLGKASTPNEGNPTIVKIQSAVSSFLSSIFPKSANARFNGGEAITGLNKNAPEAGKLTKDQHKAAWENFDSFSNSLVKQLPNVPIDTDPTRQIGDSPLVDNFNNYGLTPDPGSIEMDEQGGIARFTFKGEKVEVGKDHTGGSLAKLMEDGQIYLHGNSGAQLYHDRAIGSSEGKGPVVLTLCDGTGQAHAAKKVANVMAERVHEITAEGLPQCKTLHDAAKLQCEAVKQAQQEILERGDPSEEDSTTLVQAVITGDILSGVAVGDSKVFVFSKKEDGTWACRDLVGETRGSLDPRLSGGRLSGRGSDDVEVGNMRAFAVKLNPGDVVYVCSDGGHDSFDPSVLSDKKPGGTPWDQNNPADIKLAQELKLKNIENAVNGCENASQMHEALKKVSQEKTSDDKLFYLRGGQGKPPHIEGQGKGDDAGQTWFQYQPKTPS